MNKKETKQKQLQELLLKAQDALDAAKHFAVLNDLNFEFAGLRRGPVEDDRGYVVNGWDVDINHNDTLHDGEDKLPVQLDVLDLARDWMGSYTPGCG